MSRKGSLLTIFGMLLGSGAIGFLIVFALRDEASDRMRQRVGSASAADLMSPDGSAPGTKVAKAAGGSSVGSRKGVLGRDIAGSGLRDPWTSEQFENEMATRSYRVLELMDEILESDEKDYQARRNLLRELQRHIRALGQRVDVAVRNRLLTMLVTVEDRYRTMVGDVIGQLRGDKETAKLLVDLLKQNPDSVRTRRAVTNALGNMQVAEMVPELFSLLGEGHQNEEWIVDAIGRLADSDSRLKLLARLDKPIKSLSKQAIIRVLGQSRDPQVMETLRKGLVEAGPENQVAYLQMMAMTRDPANSGAVIELLNKNPEASARRQAIRALGLFGDDASAARLMEMIHRGDVQDQTSASSALRNIRNPATLDSLTKDWSNLDDKSRAALVGAGSNLAQPGKKLVEISMEAIRDPNRRIRSSSAIVLGHSRDPRAIDPLIGLLRNAEHNSERSTAINALLTLGTKEAAERGLHALDVISNPRQRASYERQFKKVLQRFEQPAVVPVAGRVRAPR